MALSLAKRRSKKSLIWALLAIPLMAQAEVRLPDILSDHAVLQRNQPVRVWGWAAPDEQVTVHFHEQEKHAAADAAGAWQVWLMPEQAGGPYTLTVTGSQTTKNLLRNDILVGDVWVASGQSNMEFPLKGFPKAPLKDSETEIENAKHPRIRLLLVKRAVSVWPLSDGAGVWTECNPQTAQNFSAVAYFFGREISEHENVPVGLIDSTWGGTPAQSWISFGGLGADDLSVVLRDGAGAMQEQQRINDTRANYEAQDAALKAEGKTLPTRPPLSDYHGARAPGVLFNGMIAPLTQYTIKGVIWYQGETDTSPQRGPNYDRLFLSLIMDWRHQWDQGDFPFLFVQLSSYGSHSDVWGPVRDAQRRALTLRNTEMAVTFDVGDPNNVHYADKQSVGKRLALTALGGVYGERVGYKSPEFLTATTEGSAMRVWLSHAQGLSSQGKPFGDFEVAGDDHKFKSADARIENIDEAPTIIVSSPDVKSPRYVRYGWSNVVTHYLYNSDGLPLGTFATQ